MSRDLWRSGGLNADARLSFARLLLALDDLEDRGLVTPCRNPRRAYLWTSDHPDEREAAAHGCTGCPIQPTCTEHAPAERWHVWAGADRTPRTTTKKETDR